MHLRILFAVLLCFGLLACKEEAQKSISLTTKISEQKKSAPITSLYQDLEGNAIALEDYKGKRILINYWATWCRPCIEEMPSLLKLQEALSQENYVFLLASDQSVAIINNFRDKKGFAFNFIKFNGAYAELGINALPVTVIYNTKGEEVDRVTGATQWDSQEMISKLKAVP